MCGNFWQVNKMRRLLSNQQSGDQKRSGIGKNVKKLRQIGTVCRKQLKSGRGLRITAPCVIVLPADERLRSAIIDVIMLQQGNITEISVLPDGEIRSQ